VVSAETRADGVARYGLVADIGGTNARFAWVELGSGEARPRGVRDLRCRDHVTPSEAVESYLAEAKLDRRPEFAVLAVAGPVIDGAITLTNANWTLSEREFRQDGFTGVRLINDFAALALVAGRLSAEDAPGLGGPAEGAEGETLAVLGAGTGFGVSALARDDAGQAILATEGGHVAFAPADEIEIEVLKLLMRRFGRCSVERLLSGPGLLNLHEALAEVAGEAAGHDDPESITADALAGDEACLRTVMRFCAILGSVVGDAALGYGARGGVFIAGGIAPVILPILQRSDFRTRFEAKGRFEGYMRAIPTRVIIRPHVALVGAALALQALARSGERSVSEG